MYGCSVSEWGSEDVDDDAEQELFERVADAASSFRGLPTSVNEDIVGIEIAVGGSGRQGTADFNYATLPFNEHALASDSTFAPFIRAAIEGWPAFSAHMKREAGIELAEPMIWLTNTETA